MEAAVRLGHAGDVAVDRGRVLPGANASPWLSTGGVMGINAGACCHSEAAERCSRNYTFAAISA